MEQSAWQAQLPLAVRAMKRCGYSYGQYVFVTAPTPAGMAAAQAAKVCGSLGVAIGCRDEAEEAAVRQAGFAAYRYGGDLAAFRRDFTGPHGFDYVAETTGGAEGYALTLELVKRGACVALLQEPEAPYTFFVKTAIRSQIRFAGVRTYTQEDADTAAALLKRLS